jgi:hypothetical protein
MSKSGDYSLIYMQLQKKFEMQKIHDNKCRMYVSGVGESWESSPSCLVQDH